MSAFDRLPEYDDRPEVATLFANLKAALGAAAYDELRLPI
jgi:hypothetical protein